MIVLKSGGMYRINLIRDLREKEVRQERKQRMALIVGLGCFGFFLISVLYSSLTIWQMEQVLGRERQKVDHLKQEYQKYTATRLIVDKSDLELLNSLQGKGIFWTKKLAAVAKYLPENYWITHFSYNTQRLTVAGYGYIGPQQNQLLVLNAYLDKLRADTTFADVFKVVRLVAADRSAEAGQARCAFEFTADTQAGKAGL
jgi:Tfp pilus assembly protein PilN